jgi:pimeloyl-ACP methyl ester carboxylesterase
MMTLASSHRSASLLSLLLTLAIPRAVAGQCVTKASSCTEFVPVGPGSERILVYRNRSLTTPNDTVTRALIVVHGAGGPARWEFRNVLASAFLTGNLETTVIVAPHFATNDGSACTDSLAVNELNWNCDIALGDWRVGGRARNDSAMSSFDAMDAIVLKVASRAVFPNLKSIVVAGHSAGGQFVALYQAVNRIHERLGVSTFYVVANASAYPYLDDRRPFAVAPPAGDAHGQTAFEFRPFDAGSCSNYASWPFGISNRTAYAAGVSGSQLKEQAIRRPVTFLLSQLDVDTPSGFFGSCGPMAQGRSRQARGLAFAQYLTEFNPQGFHKVIVVEACGHDARCVFTSDDALPALFPKTPQ